ncbi:SDR family NAD(P)-dependent oxidoreductase [bacterium]|jgi:dehydrogenase/reductase SDR family member 1|nr:SDR family NAD(P)-dependent oxidoreductase [Gammaproteobacteria bacterium]MDC0559290.1 SDR family NAD(P)-dependent oxidoreductase [bacterium]
MIDLSGKVAVVTGASKGIGKGIVEGLCEYGATVYFTGRTSSDERPAPPMTIEATAASAGALGGQAIPVCLDHNDDVAVEALFKRIEEEQGRLDILVNNVYQIPNPPAMGKGFWEHPISVWDAQCGVGLRGYYTASVLGAPMMVRQGHGLIVNISSRGGREYVHSASYGVGKAGVDRMVQDFAIELEPFGVCALSLSPSKVKTEFILDMVAAGKMTLDPAVAQSVRLSGRAIAALASDGSLAEKNGQILTVSEVQREYGLIDPG